MDRRCFVATYTWGLLAATAGLVGQSVPVVSPARLLAPQPGEWLIYGREYNNQRFSPLAHITRDNVSRLAPRWRFQANSSTAASHCENRRWRPRPVQLAAAAYPGYMLRASAWTIRAAHVRRTGGARR